MAELKARLEKIAPLLDEWAERYRVPGASLAVLADDQLFEAATGVVSLDTGVQTTTDAVFQIGSITKLFTSTLILQLVEQGQLELDTPVKTILPEFIVADGDATRTITVRHLLTHTSGMDGDYFHDTGRGADAVERYVLSLGALPQLHAPGDGFSYCNAGFVVAGRIIEKLTGGTWDAALRTRVLEPIGASSMGTLPEEAILHRAAVGHLPDPESTDDTNAMRAAKTWALAHSNGAAGATPFGTARDLLAFARLHLDGGSAGGKQVLRPESVAEMQRAQVQPPPSQSASAWGLGWMLFDWSGERVIGHDGGTIGQNAFFRVVPERRIAISLLTNRDNGGALYRRVMNAVLGELAGIELPPLPEARDDLDLDLSRYTGSYDRLMQRVDVRERDGALEGHVEFHRDLGPLAGSQTVWLRPMDECTFVLQAEGSRFRSAVCFLDPDADGRPAAYYSGRRANRIA